ncbi:unnamed protein product, partial [marine sediment metagenome]
KKDTFVEKYFFKTDRLNFKKKVLEKVLQFFENYSF